jgi:HK97 family phage major capsid protein
LDLKDANNNSIWFPGLNGSIKDGVPQTLYGRPCLFLDSAPAIGVTGDICLCDPTFYCIGLRQEMYIESSNAPGFTRDMTTFRLTMRFDGQPMFAKKITMEDGTELSWAAVLS